MRAFSIAFLLVGCSSSSGTTGSASGRASSALPGGSAAVSSAPTTTTTATVTAVATSSARVAVPPPPFAAPEEARWMGQYVEGLPAPCSMRQDVEFSPRLRGTRAIEVPSIAPDDLCARRAKIDERALVVPPGVELDLDSPSSRCEPPRVFFAGGAIADPDARIREMFAGTPAELVALVELGMEKKRIVRAARRWLASGAPQRFLDLQVPDSERPVVEAALTAAGLERRPPSTWQRPLPPEGEWGLGATWQGTNLQVSAGLGREDSSLPACRPFVH